jgi:hypothetical protein
MTMMPTTASSASRSGSRVVRFDDSLPSASVRVSSW